MDACPGLAEHCFEKQRPGINRVWTSTLAASLDKEVAEYFLIAECIATKVTICKDAISKAVSAHTRAQKPGTWGANNGGGGFEPLKFSCVTRTRETKMTATQVRAPNMNTGP